MFTTLISILLSVKTLIYYTFVVSFYVGKTLFDLITTAAVKSSVLCNNILTAIQILLEDFGLFLRDLSDHAGFGLSLVYKTFEYALSIVTAIYSSIASSLQWYCNTIAAFFIWISNFYTNTTALVSFLLMNGKKLLVLLGSGVWFAVTIVPIAIFSSSLLVIYYMGVLLEELSILKNSLCRQILSNAKSVIEFFWDVPLEALLGLALVTFFFYICATYSIYIRQNVISCLRRILRMFTFRISLPKFTAIHEAVKSSNNSKTGSKFEGTNDQAICVVCQINPKNMLILPCKHLCTCEECMNQIRRYSGRCPLCRTQMDRSILVYV